MHHHASPETHQLVLAYEGALRSPLGGFDPLGSRGVCGRAQVMQFEEHSKRVWSVDYSSVDPTRLVSGSDDGLIKIWALNQDSSVASINCKVSVRPIKLDRLQRVHAAGQGLGP